MWPIIGTEAIASGALTRGQLRWGHTALYPNVYVPKDVRISLFTRAVAAWLWTGRIGILAGIVAADLHGAYCSDEAAPIEMIASHRRTPPGVVVRQERISDDEVRRMGELRLTSPSRTALDLARQLPRDDAVVQLDRLAAASGVTYAEIVALANRYGGARGVEQTRVAAALMDAGARSPEESLLRLTLLDAGLPRPQTSIPVGDDFANTIVPIGWTEAKVGVEFVCERRDIYSLRQLHRHQDVLVANDWIALQVTDDYRLRSTAHRVREALRRRRHRWT